MMSIIEIIKTIVLGIVEGITEWLPISSTGHMILVDEWIKLNQSEAFMEMFFVVIQLGAILAVVVLFFNKLNPINPKLSKESRLDIIHIWIKVLIGIVPAAIFGLLLDDWLNDHLYNYITVAITLIVYGILFIIIETMNKNKKPTMDSMKSLTYKTAFFIGMFQVLALIPGTSRSGVTILGAILLGTSRFVAAEYSFYLSIPVMFGASALKLVKFGFDFEMNEVIVLLVGMATAFIVSIVTIKLLLGYIKKNDFKVFGWYRIGLGVLVVIYFLITN
jgi:undecaprenyl-diphosphatase